VRALIILRATAVRNFIDIQSYRGRLQDRRRAEKYARRFENGSRRRIDQREQRAVATIFSELKDCQTILDVPSGAGRFLQTLGANGRRIIEMDVALEILAYTQEKLGQHETPALLVQGDASRLPLADGAVDCVFSNRLLHHILKQDERACILREFHRVARRWAVVSFFNYKGLGAVRALLKRLKGRRPPYEKQPTQDAFIAEVNACGFALNSIVPTGAPWVSQKYLVFQKLPGQTRRA
jgi:ubiquinone/menaquinone biosynthesis C-methylase UbiE